MTEPEPSLSDLDQAAGPARQQDAPGGGGCARCGRRLIRRRGEGQATCAACRRLPADCRCRSLAGLEEFPPPANPMGVARELLHDRENDGCVTLRDWRGGWQEWDGTRWAESERSAVRSWTYQRLEHAASWPGGEHEHLRAGG
jgi:hypothetical protein